nr:MAG TPA: hypothetical protein [Caudoviricetes sp.]
MALYIVFYCLYERFKSSYLHQTRKPLYKRFSSFLAQPCGFALFGILSEIMNSCINA